MWDFKPARNRNAPGDPPPRWAPISKAGRIVLVATVIAAIVIGIVLAVSRTDEPAAPASDGASVSAVRMA